MLIGVFVVSGVSGVCVCVCACSRACVCGWQAGRLEGDGRLAVVAGRLEAVTGWQ